MASSQSSLLPIDIIEEIFCRTPIENLTQFNLTCKTWYSLLHDKRFIFKYLNLVQERFIRIDHTVQIIEPLKQISCSSSPIPEEFHNMSEVSTVVHCDGLLLCRCKNIGTRISELAIWNPFLKRVKWVKPLDFYSSSDFYGIGYDNVSRDNYKIIRIFDGELEEEENEVIGSYGPVIQIYDFKSNSWRIITETRLDWSIDPPCKGVSIKGNMYWVTHWNKKPELFIQSFDFSTESFKLVSNLPFVCNVLDTAALSTFKGDRLSLLHQRGETPKIEVWVTSKVDDEVVTWSKYLNVSSPDLPTLHTDHDMTHPSYYIDENDGIVVWCEKEIEDEGDDDGVCVSVYEIGKDGVVDKRIETGRCSLRSNGRPFVCGFVYVPSLVPVPE